MLIFTKKTKILRHSEPSSILSMMNSVVLLSMSVLERLTSLIPQASSPTRQKKKPPSVSPSPPLALSSPVIKKKPIQITSFDVKGLSSEKLSLKEMNADRSVLQTMTSDVFPFFLLSVM